MSSHMAIEAIDKFPILNVLKEAYINAINKSNYKIEEDIDGKETIELYHGTTSAYLNKILKEGLLPNEEQVNTWENEIPPMKNVVYLTDVWQHFFAATSYIQHMSGNLSLKEAFEKRQSITNHIKGTKVFKSVVENDFPVILKVKVLKENLIADEDFFLSKFMNDIVTASLEKRGIEIPEYDSNNPDEVHKAFDGKIPTDVEFLEEIKINHSKWLGEQCLDFYGTVAHLGAIKPEQIVEVACYPSMLPLSWTVLQDNEIYHKYYHHWQSGFGKGEMTSEFLNELEKKLPRIDVKITKRIQEIETIEVNYDKKKTKVRFINSDK